MFALILSRNFSLTNDRTYSAYHVKLPHLNVNVTYNNIFITAKNNFSLPLVIIPLGILKLITQGICLNRAKALGLFFLNCLSHGICCKPTF